MWLTFAFALASDALVLDGTPEIPDELQARLLQYENTRSGYIEAVSDDGSSVWIGTRFGETSQVHHVATPMGARKQVTFYAEPVSGVAPVPGAGDQLLVHKDVGGDEQYQIFRLDLSSGTTSVITDGTSRHSGPLLSPDGSAFTWSNNSTNGTDTNVWVRDVDDASTARQLFEAEGSWWPADWSADGSELLVMRYISATNSEMHVVDVETGKHQKLGKKEGYWAAAFGPGDTVYALTDALGDHRELYATDRKGKKLTPLTRELGWSVTDMALSPSGERLAFTLNEDGWGSLWMLDTATNEAERVELPRSGMAWGLTWAREAEVLGFSISGPDGPTDAYTWSDGAVTRWTESEMGGLDASRFVTPELVRYPTFDDLEIPAFVYKPEGEGPFPVVIQIHGGPEGQSRPWFSTTTQYLATEAGIAVVVPNVRGSTGYGKTWLGLDNGMLRENSVRDIGALLDWIAEQPDLDAEKVAVTGGSYGGYMVLASLVHYGDRITAGIDMVGISNFVTFLENTKPYRQDLRRVEYGDERDPAMRTFLESISPNNHAGEIQSALFVAQGANDPRVPQSEADQIVAAVREQGHEVWYMLAKDEGHGFRKKSNADVYRALSILFLETHLLEE